MSAESPKGLPASRPEWWGRRAHAVFTIIVFVTLASPDNTAIAILPPLYGVIRAIWG